VRVSRIEIGADNGGFLELDSSPQPLLRGEVCCARPPSPPRNYSVSGRDNGRERLIRVQSRLGWLGDSRGLAERFEGN